MESLLCGVPTVYLFTWTLRVDTDRGFYLPGLPTEVWVYFKDIPYIQPLGHYKSMRPFLGIQDTTSGLFFRTLQNRQPQMELIFVTALAKRSPAS